VIQPHVDALAATGQHSDGEVWVVVVLAVVVYLVGYAISIRLHPYRPCRSCGQSGKHRGAVFTRSFRSCRRCGGSGRELRLFAKPPR
jgi:hypothetical protein